MASAIRSTRISSPPSRAMPEASGIALGLDRLVMLATGARAIEQVLWAPIPDCLSRKRKGPPGMPAGLVELRSWPLS